MLKFLNITRSYKLLICTVICFFTVFSITNSIKAQQGNLLSTIQADGILLNFYSLNINDSSENEMIFTYQSIYDNANHISAYTLNPVQKLFDISVKNYIYFTTGYVHSKNYLSIILVDSASLNTININKANAIEKLFTVDSVFTIHFDESFPMLQQAFDFNNDGYSEFVIPSSNNLSIYTGKNKIKLSYEIKALYNFNIVLGGFNTINTLMLLMPDIQVYDMNYDGFMDIVFIYRDKIAIAYNNPKTNTFTISRAIDLSKYAQYRSGYSMFNKHIQILDYNGDGFNDMVVFNFSFATMINSNKQGTLMYLFLGTNKGFPTTPTAQIYLNNISGIESKFYFTDINNDKKADFIEIGSKVFSSEFLLNITIKRSLTILFNAYLQMNNNEFSFKPVISMSKTISIDNDNLKNTSDLSISSYNTMNFDQIVSSVIFSNSYDLNNDKVNDLFFYNFDGTYSIHLSNLSSPSIYNTKPSDDFSTDKDILKIHFSNGPYLIVFPTNEDYIFAVINKDKGKVYLHSYKNK